MLIFATQTLVHGVWNVTPEEPGTLALLACGLGTLAMYAAWTGWRPARNGRGADPRIAANDHVLEAEPVGRRAA